MTILIVSEGQTHFLMKITAKYSKNCYLYSKTYKIIAILTINCSIFHENLSLSIGYYRK